MTNLTECWMHIRTKFDGGKQINRNQRGSWEGQCTGAGLHLNGGPAWGPTCWEKLFQFQQISSINVMAPYFLK